MNLSQCCRAAALTTMILASSAPPDALAGESGALIPLVEEVAQLELMWQPGKGESEYNYYFQAAQLAAKMSRYDSASANAAAVDLLGKVLAKRGDNIELRDADFKVGVIDLVALDETARYVLAEINLGVGDQRKKIGPISKLLGRIRAEVVTNYVPKPTARGFVVIGDPETQKETEAAMRANDVNILTNNRQRQLHDMEGRFAKPVTDYLAHIAAKDPGARPLVRQAITDARLTEAEKAEVLKAMP